MKNTREETVRRMGDCDVLSVIEAEKLLELPDLVVKKNGVWTLNPSCEKNPADAQPETGVAEPGKNGQDEENE